jgi:phage FluMu protein gp41
VRLDLVPVITEALQQVTAEVEEFLPDVTLPTPVAGAVAQGREQLRDQLAEALDAALPDDFGQVTLMTEADLAAVQQTARLADQLMWAIAVLALLLLALSIAVSPARRRTVIALALGVVSALVLTMLVVRRLETALVEQIVNDDGRHAVQQAYSELAASLRSVVVIVVIAALAIGLIAHLAGRPTWTTAVGHSWTRLTTTTPEGSELDRWVAARFDLLRLAGIGVALAIVFLIGLELLPVMLIGALLGLYLWTITTARQRITDLQPPVPDSAAGIDEIPLLVEDAKIGTPSGPEAGAEPDAEKTGGTP